jgi:hypothetical protein
MRALRICRWPPAHDRSVHGCHLCQTNIAMYPIKNNAHMERSSLDWSAGSRRCVHLGICDPSNDM